MQVECPSCGCRFVVSGGAGRSKKDISAHNILRTLRDVSSVKQAAIKLNGFIQTFPNHCLVLPSLSAVK